ncbi:MAG: hypothetical protein JWN56_989 [Sphingobacteriales bacterium]|nr:hypothetical protein [Sphingobacteriales bacterium]
MENLHSGTISSKNSPIHRDQLITVQDLMDFKQQLLSEIKQLVKPEPTKSEKKWLKAFEVKQLLRLSSGKLQYLRDKGVIPFKKLGSVTYYDLERIQRLMENDSLN